MGQERNVRVFGLTSLLNDTASEMAYWILPAFLRSLGGGPEQLGLIEGVAESVAAFAKLFSGALADRVRRRKPMVVAGYAVANVAKPFLAFTTSWWQVLLIRFSDRLAKGVRGAPRDVLVAESVPKERVGAAFGLLQTMDSAGAILGPLLAMAILLRSDVRHVFLAAAIPGFLSILIVTLFARETLRSQPPPQNSSSLTNGEHRDAVAVDASADAPRIRPKSPALTRQFYCILAVLALFSIGNSSDMFLVLRAQSVGIDARFAPLLGLVFNIVYTAGAWPAGKMSDRFSRPLIAAAGLIVFAVTYATFAIAPSRAALWAAMGFYGLYYALTTPVLKALVSNAVDQQTRGRAFGMFYFVTSVTYLLASLLTGWLWKHVSPATPFWLSAGLALTAAVLLPIVARPTSASTRTLAG